MDTRGNKKSEGCFMKRGAFVMRGFVGLLMLLSFQAVNAAESDAKQVLAKYDEVIKKLESDAKVNGLGLMAVREVRNHLKAVSDGGDPDSTPGPVIAGMDLRVDCKDSSGNTTASQTWSDVGVSDAWEIYNWVSDNCTDRRARFSW
jgi:hypothetical protein